MALSIAQDFVGTVLVKGVYADIVPVRVTSSIGVVTFSITPALPAGLSLNTSTGRISGTPTVDVALANYTITVTDQS